MRHLRIEFTNSLQEHQAADFRRLVLACVPAEHSLFHNHTEDKFRYSYPLIQYKSINRRATIVCIDAAIEDIQALFQAFPVQYTLSEPVEPLVIKQLHIKEFALQLSEQPYTYTLKHWLPFNERNYDNYYHISNLIERMQLLEKILTGHILAFARGVGWHIEQPVKVSLTNLSVEPPRHIKRQLLKSSFTVSFSTNVFLPHFIGLGKHVSIGFGLVSE